MPSCRHASKLIKSTLTLSSDAHFAWQSKNPFSASLVSDACWLHQPPFLILPLVEILQPACHQTARMWCFAL